MGICKQAGPGFAEGGRLTCLGCGRGSDRYVAGCSCGYEGMCGMEVFADRCRTSKESSGSYEFRWC